MRHWCRVVVPAWLLALALAILAGCQPAGRYPAAKKKASDKSASETVARPPTPEAHYEWLAPYPSQDIPIAFVHADSDPEAWKKLPEFWNDPTTDAVRQLTAPLGLGPREAAVALRVTAFEPVVRVKIPLGLPDPTPYIPPTNRPTLAQWRLGKKLFFDKDLLPSASSNAGQSCAGCHRPAEGFTFRKPHSEQGRWNPPSLINSTYNRHQFWDGRATYLEEVIQRTLDDEAIPLQAPTAEEHPEVRHVWPGVVAKLRGHQEYPDRFHEIYGRGPTQANLAQALAAYLRTILSGNSVYDQAEAERTRRGDKELTAAHFEAVLDESDLKVLRASGSVQETAGVLLRGHALFHGKARCATCHSGPLFTDGDFHNIGIGESDSQWNSIRGQEKGRFAVLPAGLKDSRYLGAFRTPTLRSLPRTSPYMHDGSVESLRKVLEYYNGEVKLDDNRFLDPELRDGPHNPRRLNLDENELRALELFLRCLDGEPVPRGIIEP